MARSDKWRVVALVGKVHWTWHEADERAALTRADDVRKSGMQSKRKSGARVIVGPHRITQIVVYPPRRSPA